MSSHVIYLGAKNNIKDTISATAVKDSMDFTVPKPTSINLLRNSRRPKKSGFHSTVRKGKTDYSTEYKIDRKVSLESIVDDMNSSVYVPRSNDSVEKAFRRSAKYYNRFKVANPNTPLQRGFAHVFFVRPSCNILNSKYRLRTGLKHNDLFNYAYKSSPWLLRELVSSNGQSNDFMFVPSNYAASFSTSDEYINTDTYGKTYTGYKIAYGKNNIESKTAGTFTVTYNDDRNLHIYQLHRLWVEYINGVYRGEIAPAESSIKNKILDYVGACYYFLTAEDGETIIFWSKYYGVFPTTIPSNQYSWGAGNIISNPQIDISYQFSFKEDYNPYTMIEFNHNSKVGANGTKYVETYDSALGHTGRSWVGAPFVELIVDNTAQCPYTYKLRFRKA